MNIGNTETSLGEKSLQNYHFITILDGWPIRRKFGIRTARKMCVCLSGLYFPAFGLNTKKYSVSLHVQSECGKTRIRKAPNADTVHAVISLCKITHRSVNFRTLWEDSHLFCDWLVASKFSNTRLFRNLLQNKSYILIMKNNLFNSFSKFFISQ